VRAAETDQRAIAINQRGIGDAANAVDGRCN
jgi:hypothetical protein